MGTYPQAFTFYFCITKSFEICLLKLLQVSCLFKNIYTYICGICIYLTSFNINQGCYLEFLLMEPAEKCLPLKFNVVSKYNFIQVRNTEKELRELAQRMAKAFTAPLN